ncbi:MAG: two-component regulator propeller domain-containing protein, partial [Ignavibacteriaceae bacterium]
MNYKKIIFLFFIVSLSVKAQLTTGWQNYSSMNKVSSAVVTADGIWAGTEGGAFYYNFKDSTYKTFTKTEGVNGSPITATAKDSSGNIWFGSQNGKIDVYNPTTKTFKNIFDVYNSERTEKKINAIAIYGDTAFVSTSFGLSLINTKALSFYDTFFKFGNFASNIEVNYSFKKANIIYAATNSGIAVQKAGTTNLVAPESWNTFTIADGLSSNTIYKIETYRDTVFISSPKGFSIFTANGWQQIFPSFAKNVITDFIVSNDSLYFLTDGNLYSYANNTVSLVISEQDTNAVQILKVNTSEIMTASNFGIVFNFRNGAVKNISPNGPKTNIFFNMAVDAKSNLWVATGEDAGGVGFYKFNGSSWKTYDVNSAPLLSNAFHTVAIGSDNSVYFANWGSGFVR